MLNEIWEEKQRKRIEELEKENESIRKTLNENMQVSEIWQARNMKTIERMAKYIMDDGFIGNPERCDFKNDNCKINKNHIKEVKFCVGCIVKYFEGEE